jgi:long-chain acyl-CoA synthetase
VSGGARLDAKIARDLTEWGFKVIEGYGLTETSPIVTLTPPEKIKFGSAGKAVADVRIKIGHPDASGIGEILIQGPNLMQGYFRKPQETAQAIKEGWFHSGDLGYIDREGYLFITGRDKEVIVLSSGKNIYPEELESYYGQSPYIKEICILQRPQERFGQQADALFAVVVPDLEFFKRRNEVNVEEKIRWEVENLSQKLPPYQHLMGFALSTEELPRTTLKKIRRFLVREKYFKGRARMPRPQGSIAFEELPAGIDPGISRKVLEYLAAQLNKPVSLESHLEIGLGIDSLSRVELGLGLERLFSLKIPQQALYEFSTVKDIILAITQLSGKGTISATVPGAGLEKSWSQILKEEIPQQTLKRIRIKIHFIDWALAWFFKVILGFLLRVFWLLRIEGKNNFPAKGPLLITPSHSSFLDGFVVFCSLPLRLAVNTYFLGYSFIFERPLIRWAIKSLRLIPLDPNANLTEALQAVAFVLRQGKIVCIFPEGRRSVNTRINEFKKGIGILIKELDVPAAPVYIQGSHYAWARTARFPRPYPLKIIIGKSLLGLANTGAYEDIARALQAEVIKLKER